jgi:hypothetical protein
MFERDYIMRILQTFFDDLDKLIHGREQDDEHEYFNALGELYLKYLRHNRLYVDTLPADALVATFREDADGVFKAEMLAALLHHDGMWQERKDLLEKSLALYRFINDSSKDFSMERVQTMHAIEDMLQPM